jgi:hypothetical protein
MDVLALLQTMLFLLRFYVTTLRLGEFVGCSKLSILSSFSHSRYDGDVLFKFFAIGFELCAHVAKYYQSNIIIILSFDNSCVYERKG